MAACRRRLTLFLAVAILSACGNASTAPTTSPILTEGSSRSPAVSASSADPGAGTVVPSAAARAEPPTFDPTDRSTLVGVWEDFGGHRITLNDAGDFLVFDEPSGERLDYGTWQFADGTLRWETTGGTGCPVGSAEYQVAAGSAPGELTLETEQDLCSERRRYLSQGLTWVGPDD